MLELDEYLNLLSMNEVRLESRMSLRSTDLCGQENP